MYTRKTTDEYRIMANYGYGYEELYATDDRSEARQDLKAYRENEPYASFYIKKARVKIEEN